MPSSRHSWLYMSHRHAFFFFQTEETQLNQFCCLLKHNLQNTSRTEGKDGTNSSLKIYSALCHATWITCMTRVTRPLPCCAAWAKELICFLSAAVWSHLLQLLTHEVITQKTFIPLIFAECTSLKIFILLFTYHHRKELVENRLP